MCANFMRLPYSGRTQSRIICYDFANHHHYSVWWDNWKTKGHVESQVHSCQWQIRDLNPLQSLFQQSSRLQSPAYFRANPAIQVSVLLFTTRGRERPFKVNICYASTSVVSDSMWPHRPKPTRVLRPWDFPGKSTEVGCHRLLLIFPYQKTNISVEISVMT